MIVKTRLGSRVVDISEMLVSNDERDVLVTAPPIKRPLNRLRSSRSSWGLKKMNLSSTVCAQGDLPPGVCYLQFSKKPKKLDPQSVALPPR